MRDESATRLAVIARAKHTTCESTRLDAVRVVLHPPKRVHEELRFLSVVGGDGKIGVVRRDRQIEDVHVGIDDGSATC